MSKKISIWGLFVTLDLIVGFLLQPLPFLRHWFILRSWRPSPAILLPLIGSNVRGCDFPESRGLGCLQRLASGSSVSFLGFLRLLAPPEPTEKEAVRSLFRMPFEKRLPPPRASELLLRGGGLIPPKRVGTFRFDSEPFNNQR